MKAENLPGIDVPQTPITNELRRIASLYNSTDWTFCYQLDSLADRVEVLECQFAQVKRKKASFVPPTIDMVIRYGIGLKPPMPREQAEACYLFYQSNGWKVGRNPMKCWRSAVAGWNARNRGTQPAAARSWGQTPANTLESGERVARSLLKEAERLAP